MMYIFKPINSREYITTRIYIYEYGIITMRQLFTFLYFDLQCIQTKTCANNETYICTRVHSTRTLAWEIN